MALGDLRNAAIARAYAEGPEAGLAQLRLLAGDRRLAGYALYHAACGDLLRRRTVIIRI